MGICLRYAKSKEEATEMVNDGFFKVFTKMEKYTMGLSFKGWLRKIMVNSAIDYYRRHSKHHHNISITYAKEENFDETALDKISKKEILGAIQELPPSYRTVFNLFVVEGYKHHEIATMLEISEGTSKSNLAVARSKLQRILLHNSGESMKNHG